MTASLSVFVPPAGATSPFFDPHHPTSIRRAEADAVEERRNHAAAMAASMRDTERRARALAEEWESVERMYSGNHTRLTAGKSPD